MRKRYPWLLSGLLLANTVAAADRVPLVFLGLHRELSGRIDSFDRTVSASWGRNRIPVVFGAVLGTADSHRGIQLLDKNGKAGVELQLSRLAELGNKAVTLGINFPILYEPFHKWRGHPEQYGEFLEFYRTIVVSARRRNMQVIVESGVLFPGAYSAQSGFDVAAYYRTLSDTQFRDAKSDFVGVVARELRADFVNLGAEPDTEAQITNKKITSTPAGFAELIDAYVRRARQAGARNTQFGAGVGSWQKSGDEYVRALTKTGLDFIDIHVYPVNDGFLENLIAFADLAASGGKKVAISEAWPLKEASREYVRLNPVSNPAIFARDPYSFWAPLDQQFLGALVKFASWKHLLYFTPYWTQYFFAYLNYDSVQRMTPQQVLERSQAATVDALLHGKTSETGEFWKCAIRYGACLDGRQ
jgi:hypothetical protein